MTPLILDTHAAVHELVSASMPERQAETVVRQQARLLEQNLATKTDIATIKADIEALRQGTKADIETLRQGTKTDIPTTKIDIDALRQGIRADFKAFKVDLIKWIVGINIGNVTLTVATIKLL